ncbi:MAG TPA: transaldolase family protein [Patescibacteria group bacterium]|nr:transaldolase family protein [Patescibacteria group bacterium]
MTRFILDSGNPEEYKQIIKLAKKHDQEIWGSTTNPSLIAKKLAESGKKLTMGEAFALQKDIVMQILQIVPGAVSAEVYADMETMADEMIQQGEEIARWDERVVVKLPTTLEGFKARTELRKKNITTNNTLVFSPQQIFAICLHEHVMQQEFGASSKWPPFISPFIGRLDDIGENGIDLVRQGMELKKHFSEMLWMLSASIRTTRHIADSIAAGSELITAPAKAYIEWFKSGQIASPAPEGSQSPEKWKPEQKLLGIETIDGFMQALTSGELDITHPLTEKGIIKFVEDWKAILS